MKRKGGGAAAVGGWVDSPASPLLSFPISSLSLSLLSGFWKILRVGTALEFWTDEGETGGNFSLSVQ